MGVEWGRYGGGIGEIVRVIWVVTATWQWLELHQTYAQHLQGEL